MLLLQKESRKGHDLNVSQFERLITEGFPFSALKQQHRMRRSISAPVRALTYPNLVDGPGTTGREDVRGLRGNVLFLDHEWLEAADTQEGQGALAEATASKVCKMSVLLPLSNLQHISSIWVWSAM